MTISRVQGGSSNSGAGNSISVTLSAIGSGNTVVTCCTWDSAGVTLTSVTDNQSNSYTVSENINDAPDTQAFATAVRGNITNAPTVISFNFSAAPSSPGMIATEYSGVLAATDPRDGHTGQLQNAVATTTNAATSGNITTSVNGDQIIGFIANTNPGNDTVVAGTGFTVRDSFTTGGTNVYLEDESQATAGSVAATFTVSAGAGNWITCVMALQPSSGLVLNMQQRLFM